MDGNYFIQWIWSYPTKEMLDRLQMYRIHQRFVHLKVVVKSMIFSIQFESETKTDNPTHQIPQV